MSQGPVDVHDRLGRQETATQARRLQFVSKSLDRVRRLDEVRLSVLPSSQARQHLPECGLPKPDFPWRLQAFGQPDRRCQRACRVVEPTIRGQDLPLPMTRRR